MAKKRKRKLQPHEKILVQSVIIGLCIALLFAVLGWPREITFEQTEITVRSCDIAGTRNSRRIQIITTDGLAFHIFHAQIPLVELQELLVPGTEAHIEYCHDWLIRLSPNDAWPVTKLTINGQLLVDNTPGDNTYILRLAWLSLPFLIFGFLCWADGEHLLKKWKKKREKERKRRKKEGLTK